jgi:molybdenum cofactor sulfurtransferase
MKDNQRFSWILYVNITLCVLLVAALAKILVFSPKSLPKLQKFKTLDSSNYPEDLDNYRKQYMRHLGNVTYLDYTGAGVYPDQVIDQYREVFTSRFPYAEPSNSSLSSDKIVKKARRDLLDFLGTDEEHYSVIFLASATQALKLVGENFPWTKKSRFFYTRYNHNSVLGIRKYAISHGAQFNATRSYESLLAIARNMTTPGVFKHLLAMPLQDNFAGTKPSKEIMHEISHINGSFAIIADAAAYLPTNKLNLTEYPFHAVVMSFYKIFGFPNYGALVVRNDFAKHLVKTYYTSNSAEFTQCENDDAKILDFPLGLEDDVVVPENAYALSLGISFLENIGMDNINAHVAKLTKKLYNGLAEMHSLIYGNHHLQDESLQGGIVSFNLLHSDGQFYGYASVVEDLSNSGFHLRGGCHCNPGACFNATGLREQEVKAYFDKKTTCGDKYDVIDGIPLGAVRASLGWASTEKDVDDFLEYIRNNYIL